MMKRVFTAGTMTALTLVLASHAAHAAECVNTAQPGQVPAAKLVYVDESADVSATFCNGTAGYTSDTYLVSPGYKYIGTGHLTASGATVDLGFFSAGTELMFSIYVRDSGYTYYTGPGSRNPDGLVHAAVTDLGGGDYHVGFEDLYLGGDQDYDDINIVITSSGLIVVGPTPADTDGDGVADYDDNCIFTPNPDQLDSDNTGIGDACDPCPFDVYNDGDDDGICGDVDNCPASANSNQADDDGDGVGDVCDADDDDDGVADVADNCPLTYNTDQTDWDQDGAGNACDTDDDGDGVSDNVDQCPMTPNGRIVLSNGCSLEELVPCTPLDNPWKSHGAYVKAVVQATKLFIAQGLLTQAQADAIISAAAGSSCGH